MSQMNEQNENKTENTDNGLKAGDIVYIKRNRREDLSIVLNMIIVCFAGGGTYMMFKVPEKAGVFMVSGLANLKFFTVISNELILIGAILWLVFDILNKERNFTLFKLTASSAAMLTFVIVACFLRPLYPELDMYAGGNKYFHLLAPLASMVEFVLLETRKKIPFKYAVISAVTSLIYGSVYLANIMINGRGEWPDSNDWYGFLNWGYTAGIAIFGVAVLMNFALACVLRWGNNFVNRKKRVDN